MDRYQKIQEQVKLLKSNEPLDREFILEELLAMSRSEKRGLKSYLYKLFEHLIKLECAFEEDRLRNKNHWQNEINTFKNEIQELLEESPSLMNVLKDVWETQLRKVIGNMSQMDYINQECAKNFNITFVELLILLEFN